MDEGAACGHANAYGVYTRLGNYKDWIASTIAGRWRTRRAGCGGCRWRHRRRRRTDAGGDDAGGGTGVGTAQKPPKG